MNFRVQGPYWSHPFLTMPNQKIFHFFHQLLIFVNLHEDEKIRLFHQIFFNYFPAPWSTLGHSQGVSLTNPTITTKATVGLVKGLGP